MDLKERLEHFLRWHEPFFEEKSIKSFVNKYLEANQTQLYNQTPELKKAVGEKLAHFKSMIGNPKYSSRIEQNAAETLVRELKYLDSIAEYETQPDREDEEIANDENCFTVNQIVSVINENTLMNGENFRKYFEH